MDYQYAKLGTNKGRRRLWFEGEILNKSGFAPNTPYRRVNNPDGKQISLFKLEESDYVSTDRRVTKSMRGDKPRPIIDLCDKSIETILGDVERVRVQLSYGLIVISAHPEDQAKSDRESRFTDNKNKGQITHASLFTGGGISTDAIHSALNEEGLIKTGCTWVCEADLKYINEAQQNCFAIDDETVILNGLVEEIETQLFTQVDVLSLSMECAGFSKAGKVKHKMSAEEHSGTALFGVMNAIKASNPAVIISENVVEAMNSPMYVLLTSELKRLGYKVFETELSNKQTGSVERRRRYWLTAISENLAPDDISLSDVAPNLIPLKHYLNSVPESMWADNQYLKDKQIRDAAAGKGFANRQLLTGEEIEVGTIGRHYAKRRSTEPFMVRADNKERLFTPEEHAKLKSIPQRLVPKTGMTIAHQILGQSVDYLQPYKLMQCVINRIKPVLIS